MVDTGTEIMALYLESMLSMSFCSWMAESCNTLTKYV